MSTNKGLLAAWPSLTTSVSISKSARRMWSVEGCLHFKAGNLSCCCLQTSYFGGDLPGVLLDQGAGYGIVVGFGFFFVFLTIALVFGDYRARGGRHYNSEDFNTAGW